jgi:dimethylaniline monooxygenase (N-oxide forming)
MKLCIIGAGGAGLIAVKRALEFGCDVTAFESTDKVGGLWNYTEQVGKDEYGEEIHTSMYQNLVTNLPIEVMTFPCYPFPEQKESFVPSEVVLEYYQSFAEDFKLQNVIKFRHHVVRVRPLAKNRWEVIVKNLPGKIYETLEFDAILVCSGHFHSSALPVYGGQELFEGKQFHSHDYRRPEPLKGQKVLVIGGSYSGVDIVQESSKFADYVAWSHHLPERPDAKCFNDNVEQMADVIRFTQNGAEFVDGSYREFTVVIYCTGYEYKFPFLSVDCGISTEDKFVKPLYMHCLSINRPTLGIIGLSNLICPNPMFDLQARFCLTFMTGKKQLPSRKEMMVEYENDLAEKRARGFAGKKSHYMGEGVQDKYYADLAAKAGIEPIPKYIGKMHTQCLLNRKKDFANFRNIKFTVVSDDHFTMTSTQDL